MDNVIFYTYPSMVAARNAVYRKFPDLKTQREFQTCWQTLQNVMIDESSGNSTFELILDLKTIEYLIDDNIDRHIYHRVPIFLKRWFQKYQETHPAQF